MNGTLKACIALGCTSAVIGGVLVASQALTVRGARAGDHARSEHAHTASHGGSVVAVGEHHLEAVVEKGGGLRLYVLGKDEAELVPIPVNTLAAEAQSEHGGEAEPLSLKAQRQSGEPAGATSLFRGQLPEALVGQPVALSLTVPLSGKSYRARLLLQPHRKDHIDPEMAAMLNDHAPMPPPRASDAEAKLYGEPGGAYTAADIAANGSLPPSVKFKGVMASHDMNPERGDRLCPITNTRANPRFRWLVGGQEYLFCCPPCIDEFVQRARSNPRGLRSPAAYVKR